MRARYLNPKLPVIWHGGDYNPDQWPREVLERDVRLMNLAGCQVATVGIFAWAKLEPEEGRFDFAWLDEAIDLLDRNDLYFILATPSAAPPAWFSKKYPETLRTGEDRVRRLHGNRVNFNLGSELYRERTRDMARRLAERYGAHPRLLAWHMSNEYGGADYGRESSAAFRTWLKEKFNGSLDALNHAYWTAFWGHTFTDWDQIEPPGPPYGETAIQGLTVDWKRFVTDQTIDFMLNEAAPLREISPDVPVTTNMMGTYEGLDYRRVARHLDFSCWDSYPAPDRPLTDPGTWLSVSFKHDLMRSVKLGRPWLLMESTPSSANWYSTMQLKRPGLHRFEALHALAHGADGVQYFQWRQSRGGMEQYHGAVVGHAGEEDTRVFKEVAEVGRILAGLDKVAGTVPKSEVALIFDWPTRWALDAACGPVRSEKGYERTCIDFYRALWHAGITVDIIGQEDPLDGYKLVVAPMAYSLTPGFPVAVERFVRSGGTFVTTYLTGWVDENSLVFENGFLSPLSDVLGVRSEEIDALFAGQTNVIDIPDEGGLGITGSWEAREFCELIHPTTASVVGTYTSDFYAGRPAVTVNRFGHGTAVYVAARCEGSFQDALLRSLARKSGVRHATRATLPEGAAATIRYGENAELVFLMNPTGVEMSVHSDHDGQIQLGPYDVAILERAPEPVAKPMGDAVQLT